MRRGWPEGFPPGSGQSRAAMSAKTALTSWEDAEKEAPNDARARRPNRSPFARRQGGEEFAEACAQRRECLGGCGCTQGDYDDDVGRVSIVVPGALDRLEDAGARGLDDEVRLCRVGSVRFVDWGRDRSAGRRGSVALPAGHAAGDLSPQPAAKEEGRLPAVVPDPRRVEDDH